MYMLSFFKRNWIKEDLSAKGIFLSHCTIYMVNVLSKVCYIHLYYMASAASMVFVYLNWTLSFMLYKTLILKTKLIIFV